MDKGNGKVGGDDCVRAIWNDSLTEALLRLCVGEMEKGNRNKTCWTRIGWYNIVEGFNSRTGRKFSKKQIKNHLDNLRGFWRDFLTLKKNETGWGWDVATGTITATNAWWTEKLKVDPNLKKFKTKGLPHFELMEIIFGDSVTIGEPVWTPTSGALPRHMQEQWDQVEGGGEEVGYEEDVEVGSALEKGEKRKAPPVKGSKKHKRLSGAAALSQRFDTSSESVAVQEQKEEAEFGIRTVLEMLKELPGLERGSPLHIFAVRIMRIRVNRELFVLLEDDDLRLKLLEDEFEVSKRDKKPQFSEIDFDFF